MPPSYRQANSSGYAVKGGEVNGYTPEGFYGNSAAE
jgi:hypothetical protein